MSIHLTTSIFFHSANRLYLYPVKENNHAIPLIQLGRDTCNNLGAAQQREWLVANGVGGYAMGTVSGIRTRGYHGLLIAALDPPLGRMLMLASLEETLVTQAESFELFTNSWQPGEVKPNGYQYIESFSLDGTTPVWIYNAGGVRLEKRIWMQPDVNTTYIRYTLLEANTPVEMAIKTLVNHRDHHARSDTSLDLQVSPVEHGLRIVTPDENAPLYVLSAGADVQPQHDLYENLYLSSEADRGLAARDTNLMAGIFHATLNAGDILDIVASTEAEAALDGDPAYQARGAYEQALIAKGPQAANDNAALRQLVLAADQFVVTRTLADGSDGCSVIAGYPWFGDWGRDTMISLPGLTLETGSPELAAKILRTFAQFVDKGMLPNRFPDTDENPEYNTVDATLWYFQAIHAYYMHAKDKRLLRELFPVLQEIVDWHTRGTRHNIHVDPTDQLLYAGEPGTQLTWMDAKYNDWVVTPRIGKPVEVNALWYNALAIMADFAHRLGNDSDAAQYKVQAKQVRLSFNRFWNEATGYCYDVIDGPSGNEAALRPNQLFAASLPHSPLTKSQQKAIVDACERSLLTPYGLRSLSPTEPGYIGHYGGGTEQRDGAYHQGTVWAWLIGPFVEAHLRVYGNQEQAKAFLGPLLQQHLFDYGLGSVSEIFDGNEPYTAQGCPWQAWSVAELLRVSSLTTGS